MKIKLVQSLAKIKIVKGVLYFKNLISYWSKVWDIIGSKFCKSEKVKVLNLIAKEVQKF